MKPANTFLGSSSCVSFVVVHMDQIPWFGDGDCVHCGESAFFSRFNMGLSICTTLTYCFVLDVCKKIVGD